MPWTNPKTDWDTNPINPTLEDFNRIEGNVEFLKTDIETKKGVIVNALNSAGIASLIADTHVQIAGKILAAKRTGVSITPSTVNQVIPTGIYDIDGGIVVGDADLISANIKAGTNIFGVAGSSNVVDTSAGDAVSADIISGKKAYVDGVLVTGNIPSKAAATITPSTTNQTIAAGQYLSGAQTIAGDVDLISANIRAGANIFGVAGKSTVVDTVDGSADAGHILSGYTAYSGGSKKTGTIPSKTAQTYTPGTVNQTIAAGQYLSAVQTILGSTNLLAANIKNGVNIFGVVGNLAVNIIAPSNDWRLIDSVLVNKVPSSTYEIVKQITINVTGNVRVLFKLEGDIGYARVFKNGVPVGTEQYKSSPSSAANITFAQDFSVNSGDKLQLGIRLGTGFVKIPLFQVGFNINSTSLGGTVDTI